MVTCRGRSSSGQSALLARSENGRRVAKELRANSVNWIPRTPVISGVQDFDKRLTAAEPWDADMKPITGAKSSLILIRFPIAKHLAECYSYVEPRVPLHPEQLIVGSRGSARIRVM